MGIGPMTSVLPRRRSTTELPRLTKTIKSLYHFLNPVCKADEVWVFFGAGAGEADGDFFFYFAIFHYNNFVSKKERFFH